MAVGSYCSATVFFSAPDVEAARVGDHVDGGGVNVVVVDGDVGVLRAHGRDGASPQVAGVDEHIVFVY